MQIPTNQNRDLAAESLASCYLLLLKHAKRNKQNRSRIVSTDALKTKPQLEGGKHGLK